MVTELLTKTLSDQMSLYATAITVSVIYPVICALLRFRRIQSLEQQYLSINSTGCTITLASLSLSSAHRIVKTAADLEFPSLFEKGLQFALFRTYGIPTISDLLVLTRQLTTGIYVSKRYADTAVIVAEIYGQAPGSPRSLDAFARLNFLHGNYFRRTKTGPRILEDDMLYTLSLFMTQPVEWINKYEWRQLTELELCAFGLFHLYMGMAMNIDFSALPSGGKPGEPGRWADGLRFYQELETWRKEYEARVMVPDEKNYETAKHTRDLMLRTYPKFMHGFLSNVMSALMDDRLREAIKFAPAPAVYLRTFDRFMAVRRFVLRYLTLPRPDQRLFNVPFVTDDTSLSGARWLSRYDTMPHYVKPTLWNRYGPGALMSRALNVPLPGDEGMQPGGWTIGEVGPKYFEGKGKGDFEQEKNRIKETTKQGERESGCPFLMRS